MASLAMPTRAPVRRPLVDMPGMTNLGGAPMSPTPMQSPNLPTAPLAPPAPTPTGAFVPPDPAQIANDPAVQFRLNRANIGANRSAAAHGTLLSGGFQAKLAELNQGLASQEYDKLYGRSLSAYEANRGTNAQNFGQSLAGFGAQRDAYHDATGAELARTGVVNANQEAQDLFRQQMENYRAEVEAQRMADTARMNAEAERTRGTMPVRRPMAGSPRMRLG